MKLKRSPTDSRNSIESSEPGYLDAVDGDPAVRDAWTKLATRYKELWPDLDDAALLPRGDPRPRFRRRSEHGDDAELERLENNYHDARRQAMNTYAHLRGAR